MRKEKDQKNSEYGHFLRISTYSVQMRENTDQRISEYEHFPRSASPTSKMELLIYLRKKLHLRCSTEFWI